jgi:heterotetrameric sarcosine oxidase delta subunit
MPSMSFVLTCPHCGVREVADFAFGGELSSRPREAPSLRELCEYNYFRRNVAGVQREWWYHRSGCRTWFQAERDTRTNRVLRVALPGELDGDARGLGAAAGESDRASGEPHDVPAEGAS